MQRSLAVVIFPLQLIFIRRCHGFFHELLDFSLCSLKRPDSLLPSYPRKL
jgi:hypothetical protein